MTYGPTFYSQSDVDRRAKNQRMNHKSDLGWFEHLSPLPQPSLRLFCLPHAGGTADAYRDWRRFLSPQVDLCLVHLPGRGRRIAEKAFNRLAPLVDVLAGCMAQEIDVPFVLYGHSMGGLISFELARELFRRYKTGPRHLFLSGCPAPHLNDSRCSTFSLPDQQFLAELKRLNGTSTEVLNDPELLELFLPVLRADFELVETYQYRSGGRLPCHITVYGGRDDEQVGLEGVYGWKEYTSGNCTIRLFPGGHFFVYAGRDFRNAFQDDVFRVAVAKHLS